MCGPGCDAQGSRGAKEVIPFIITRLSAYAGNVDGNRLIESAHPYEEVAYEVYKMEGV